jgi:hypothetical protein
MTPFKKTNVEVTVDGFTVSIISSVDVPFGKFE